MAKNNKKSNIPYSSPRWKQAIPPEVIGKVELSENQKEEARKLMSEFIRRLDEEKNQNK